MAHNTETPTSSDAQEAPMQTFDLDELSGPKGITKAPGDFARSRGIPYVSVPGETVKSGPRKGLPKLTPYGRPSGLGKDIENTYNLERWNERQVVLGMLAPGEHPLLDEAIAKLSALTEQAADERDIKSVVDGIVVEAKRVADAFLAAERGTHMHEVTEDSDGGGDWLERAQHGELVLGLDAGTQLAMLKAWQQCIEFYGLEVLHIERRVVHDGWRQAGTLDRVARLTRDITFDNGVTLKAGTVLVLDIKTGKLKLTPGGKVMYWLSYPIQLACYAASVPYDTEADERGEWEFPIDQEWAVIAHLPVDEALDGKPTCRLILVDLTAGRWAVDEVIARQKQWQRRDDLFAFVAEIEAEEEAEQVDEGDHVYRMWLTSRLAQIGADDAARARMVALWPAGVPGLKTDHVHTTDELAAIEAVATRIEAMHQLPFVPDPRPQAQPPEAKPLPMPWRAPDEGEILGMDHEDVVGLKKRIERLEPAEQSIAEQWMKEAVQARRGFAIKQVPSRRRWLIYRVALDLATVLGGDPDSARATLAMVLPEAEQLAITIGSCLGSLSIDEARRLLELIPVLNTEHALVFDGEVPRWSAATAA